MNEEKWYYQSLANGETGAMRLFWEAKVADVAFHIENLTQYMCEVCPDI